MDAPRLATYAQPAHILFSHDLNMPMPKTTLLSTGLGVSPSLHDRLVLWVLLPSAHFSQHM